ncbi:hypothetical protein [Ligilactobacillus murinus]|jgi:hypothetical protein|uniref:hypothetical protein n=1 Tax=Ligilactobacillus murinus TaxID=1622 RepID=UPI0010949314|nr:hypothetical protein [Ligilactobacillus murinus]TGY53627.1 hypothetical protein E5341_02030 [Ligilactobacillus murinus]
MKAIANKLKLKLQNVPLKEFKPSNDGARIVFTDENDWNDFVYWLRNNWVKWGQGDIIGSSWNKKHKFVYIDFR